MKYVQVLLLGLTAHVTYAANFEVYKSSKMKDQAAQAIDQQEDFVREVAQKIDEFVIKLEQKYLINGETQSKQIDRVCTAEMIPGNYVAFYRSPKFMPKMAGSAAYCYITYTPNTLQPFIVKSGKPVNGLRAILLEIKQFLAQLADQYEGLGFTCGGATSPMDQNVLIAKVNNPDYKKGLLGSGEMCRLYLKK
jgi:hypothetical protein